MKTEKNSGSASKVVSLVLLSKLHIFFCSITRHLFVFSLNFIEKFVLLAGQGEKENGNIHNQGVKFLDQKR